MKHLYAVQMPFKRFHNRIILGKDNVRYFFVMRYFSIILKVQIASTYGISLNLEAIMKECFNCQRPYQSPLCAYTQVASTYVCLRTVYRPQTYIICTFVRSWQKSIYANLSCNLCNSCCLVIYVSSAYLL